MNNDKGEDLEVLLNELTKLPLVEAINISKDVPSFKRWAKQFQKPRDNEDEKLNDFPWDYDT